MRISVCSHGTYRDFSGAALFNISNMLKGLPVNVTILTSLYNRGANLIASGAADIVIGTHALIQEGIIFRKLGLVVSR